MKINKADIQVLEWYFDSDATELATIDSLLVDSETTLAELKYKLNDSSVEEVISLEVRGDVKVYYEGEIYRYPSEFPSKLKMIFKTLNPIEQLDIEELEVRNNNWCEIFYTINGQWQYDVADTADGCFTSTEEDVKDFLLDMIVEIWGNEQ